MSSPSNATTKRSSIRVRHNMVGKKESKWSDFALPYALFFVALVPGITEPVSTLIGTPLHEMGHVLAAIATGGYGIWDFTQWNQTIIRGGNLEVIVFAGVLFHYSAATGIASVLLVFRKATWLAGLLVGTVIYEFPIFANQADWDYFPDTARQMTRVVHIMGPIYIAIIVVAFVVSITRLIIATMKR